AGVSASWLADGAGLTVEGLPTYYGRLDLRLGGDGSGALVISLGGDLEVPPGGIVLRPPLAGPLLSVAVNGREATAFDPNGVTIRVVPARVVLRVRAGASPA